MTDTPNFLDKALAHLHSAAAPAATLMPAPAVAPAPEPTAVVLPPVPVSSLPASYDRAALKAELTRDEKRMLHLYDDATGQKPHVTGNISGGIGHNFEVPMSDYIIDAIYDCDETGCVVSLDQHAPWWRGLDSVRQRVIMNMIFNMGWAGLSTFVNTLADMEKGQYAAASSNMLVSEWAKEVGLRATRLAYMMAHGQIMPGEV